MVSSRQEIVCGKTKVNVCIPNNASSPPGNDVDTATSRKQCGPPSCSAAMRGGSLMVLVSHTASFPRTAPDEDDEICSDVHVSQARYGCVSASQSASWSEHIVAKIASS